MNDDEQFEPRRTEARKRLARVHDHGGIEAALRSDPRVAMWLADPLDVDTGRALMRLLGLPDLVRLAVMPDVHLSSDVCVGSVLATTELLYPQAVGGDIGCGMTAARFGATDLPLDAERLYVALEKEIDVMVASKARRLQGGGAGVPHAGELRSPVLRAIAAKEAEPQLGTLGRGNHFVEVQRSGDGDLWVMVHSGSRRMGQAVAGHYIRAAQGTGLGRGLHALSMKSDLGADYLSDQEWCVRYAKTNRALLASAAVRAIASIVGATIDRPSMIDVPHNLVRIEEHGGERLIVHRKGAAPAPLGQAGLIPGSAGTMSVHVFGKGEPTSLCSSSHGAGRVLSRTEAKHAISEKDFRRQMKGVAFDVERAGSLRDEAPGAYRDLRRVLEAQRELVGVERTLRPLVSLKAGG